MMYYQILLIILLNMINYYNNLNIIIQNKITLCITESYYT